MMRQQNGTQGRLFHSFTLEADRLSAHAFRVNQLRLWLTTFAHVLIEALRRPALARTGRRDNCTDHLQQITGRRTICEKSAPVTVGRVLTL
jgi:hypothetical protein